jgi:hypothetical protein
MEEFIKEIESIEAIQTDTRAGCILMLTELAKFKKRIKEKLVKESDSLPPVSETPQEAFDRGYTAGMAIGRKLMGKGSR